MKSAIYSLYFMMLLLVPMLIIVIPILSIFLNIPLGSPLVTIIIYLMALPIWAYLHVRHKLSESNLEFEKLNIIQKIRDTSINFKVLAVIVLVFVLLSGYFIESSLQPSEEKIEMMQQIYGRTVQLPVLIQYYAPLAVGIFLGMLLIGAGREASQHKIQNLVVRGIIPAILGIMTSLSAVISGFLSPLITSSGTIPTSITGSGIFTKVLTTNSLLTVPQFQLIIGIHLIIMTAIISYFIAKIKFAQHSAALVYNVGLSLILSTSVFVFSLLVGSYLFSV